MTRRDPARASRVRWVAPAGAGLALLAACDGSTGTPRTTLAPSTTASASLRSAGAPSDPASASPPSAGVPTDPSSSRAGASLVPTGSRNTSVPVTPDAPSPVPAGAPLTCATLNRDSDLRGLATFAAGGTAPTGVPLPQAVPALLCAGTAAQDGTTRLTAVSWASVTRTQYGQQLTGGGFTGRALRGRTVYTRRGAPHDIVLLEAQGRLVAIFGPPTG